MSKQDFYNQLVSQEIELEEALASVRKLKKYYEQEQGDNVVITVQENRKIYTNPNLPEFDKEWTQREKVQYALTSINKGTAEEVAERLLDLDDSFSKEKANHIATHKLSALYRNKLIDAVKVGKKYRYYAK